MRAKPTSPGSSFKLAIGVDWPVLSLIFVKRWPAGQSLTLPVPCEASIKEGELQPHHVGMRPAVIDWVDYQYRTSFFSTDKGTTWKVLQHCVSIGQEADHVVGAAFRISIKADVVETCVICTTKWAYFDHDYSLCSAPGILLKAQRDNRTASFHQVGELAQELDDADLEIEEREASDQCWYEAAASAREALAEEARADAGESKFAVADSLQISWLVGQRSDTTLYALLANPDEKRDTV